MASIVGPALIVAFKQRKIMADFLKPEVSGKFWGKIVKFGAIQVFHSEHARM